MQPNPARDSSGKFRFHDLTGQTFGRLFVESRGPNTKHSATRYWVLCTCGSRKLVRAEKLTGGRTRSCGCLNREEASRRNGTHRQRNTPEYTIWASMKQRCSNPKNKRFKHYGGRGITVCQQWQDSFEAFLADVGPRPGPEYSLDRFPNPNGHYEPGNVRWATKSQQARNTRNRILVSYKGTTMDLASAAEMEGMPYHMAWERYQRGNFPEKQEHKPSNLYVVIYEGKAMSIKQAARIAGVYYQTALRRFHRGQFP
jgi:hypothetical protein